MDIENCAVTDDSLSLLESEIKMLASKPKEFFTSFVSNKELLMKTAEFFLKREPNVEGILRSLKTQGVTGSDISGVLRYIKKEAKKWLQKSHQPR